MAEAIGGTAFVFVDGTQYKLRGNFTVSPSAVERTMIAGQDGVHGYQELPRVPYIEGDISTTGDLRLEALLKQVNVTVIAQLINKMEYVLHGACSKGGFENNTRDGQVRVRWEGEVCEEISL